MIPEDPAMLVSFINMKLRDGACDLDELCAEEDVAREELEAKLYAFGYRYDGGLRRVVPR